MTTEQIITDAEELMGLLRAAENFVAANSIQRLIGAYRESEQRELRAELALERMGPAAQRMFELQMASMN